MTDSLIASPRMQHLGARYHWLREQVGHDKTLRLVYCNTLIRSDCRLPHEAAPWTSYCPLPRCSIWSISHWAPSSWRRSWSHRTEFAPPLEVSAFV
jgi:hypothetical protein